jgi:hypothetical protein
VESAPAADGVVYAAARDLTGQKNIEQAVPRSTTALDYRLRPVSA